MREGGGERGWGGKGWGGGGVGEGEGSSPAGGCGHWGGGGSTGMGMWVCWHGVAQAQPVPQGRPKQKPAGCHSGRLRITRSP